MQNRRNNTPRWQAMFQELITVRNEITAEAALHQTIIDIGRINELAALIARTTAVIGELQIFLSDPTPADLIFLESFQNALPFLQRIYYAAVSTFTIKTSNNALLEKIKPSEEKNPNLLTKDEIAQFENYIKALSDGAKRKEETNRLDNYINTIAAECALSFGEIKQPVIVKSKNPPYLSFFYEYDNLKTWIETENDHTKIYKRIRLASNPPTTEALTDMEIYTSYADYFAPFISDAREILKKLPVVLEKMQPKEALENKDVPTTFLVAATSDHASLTVREARLQKFGIFRTENKKSIHDSIPRSKSTSSIVIGSNNVCNGAIATSLLETVTTKHESLAVREARLKKF
jgi:hypothetical protein